MDHTCECGETLDVSEDLLGQDIQCPTCNRVFQVAPPEPPPPRPMPPARRPAAPGTARRPAPGGAPSRPVAPGGVRRPGAGAVRSPAGRRDPRGLAREEPRKKSKAPMLVIGGCVLAGAVAAIVLLSSKDSTVALPSTGDPVRDYNATMEKIIGMRTKAQGMGKGDPKAALPLLGETRAYLDHLIGITEKLKLTAAERALHAKTLTAVRNMTADVADAIRSGREPGLAAFQKCADELESLGKDPAAADLVKHLRDIGIRTGAKEIFASMRTGPSTADDEREKFFKGVHEDFEKQKEDVHKSVEEQFQKSMRYDPPKKGSGTP